MFGRIHTHHHVPHLYLSSVRVRHCKVPFLSERRERGIKYTRTPISIALIALTPAVRFCLHNMTSTRVIAEHFERVGLPQQVSAARCCIHPHMTTYRSNCRQYRIVQHNTVQNCHLPVYGEDDASGWQLDSRACVQSYRLVESYKVHFFSK